MWTSGRRGQMVQKRRRRGGGSSVFLRLLGGSSVLLWLLGGCVNADSSVVRTLSGMDCRAGVAAPGTCVRTR
jgi:hypothetical protein